MTCPKCGADQPHATECAVCGVEVAKDAAARPRSMAAGIIFYYPPVLAAIGVFALVKGLWQGDISGTRYR